MSTHVRMSTRVCMYVCVHIIVMTLVCVAKWVAYHVEGTMWVYVKSQ